MAAQVRLNRYERGIVEALQENFDYPADVARGIVVRYIGVVRKLGGYDSCLDHAERLHRAHSADHPPEQWLERIRVLETESRLAGAIPELEEYQAHVR